MNSQRILRHLVQVALIVGTVALLPSVQAKSVAAVDAPTPITVPSQNLTRGVRGRLTPDARPLLVAPGCPHCRPTQNIGQARPSIQRDESFDPTPLLVAPTGCHSGCRPTASIGRGDSITSGQSQSVAGQGCRGSCSSGGSFNATPVLVAPDCGSGNCNWFRFFG